MALFLLSLLATALVPLVPASAPVRAALGLSGLWLVVRTGELAVSGLSASALQRAWFLAAPYDTRKLRPTRSPANHGRAAARGALATLACVAAVGAFAIALEAESPVRWLAGAAGFYLICESVVIGQDALHELLALRMPPVLVQPMRSRSVAEFWGRRWNRPVHDWLRLRVFLPLARRRQARLGLALAFVVSAFGHAYPVAVSLDLAMTASMAVFFLAQPVVMGLERVVRLDRWPTPARHGWTALWLLGLSPLFVEPLLRLIESA